MDEALKKKIYWCVVVFMALVAVYTFTHNYFYDKEKEQQSIVISKTQGIYKLVAFSNQARNFTIDIQDAQTGQIYHDQLVSVDCPLYNKNSVGEMLKLNKLTNIRLSTNETFDSFDGGYDILCTDKKTNQDNSNTNSSN